MGLTILMPRTLDEALAAQSSPEARKVVAKAGGVDVVDHLKEGIWDPSHLNNLLAVEDASLRAVERESMGALATLADIAASSAVRRSASAIAMAAEAAATPQVRNTATAAGNLLQRPRCWYYRNAQFACLKKGGHTCYAVEGENKFHAIFGDGPCHIVHPSNLALALSVCDGAVIARRPGSSSVDRTVSIADLYAMPDRSILSEHTLAPDELITRITWKTVGQSAHYEIREKQSFDWPLVMVAVSYGFAGGGQITGAKVCAGAVAPIPWRLPAVEKALEGLRPDDDAAIRKACALAVNGAKPMTDNAYKTRLLPVAVHRAVRLAAGLDIDDLFHGPAEQGAARD